MQFLAHRIGKTRRFRNDLLLIQTLGVTGTNMSEGLQCCTVDVVCACFQELDFDNTKGIVNRRICREFPAVFGPFRIRLK